MMSPRSRQPLGPITRLATVLVLLVAVPIARAQAPLAAVDGETSVSDISFHFVDGQPFTPAVLKEQIWHREPGFWDRVTRFLPLVSAPEFPFSPIELQKDVVRLERYYGRQGFLHPTIDYPASQVDTTDNEIRIIFTIREGPPLILQDVGFYGEGGDYAAQTFAADLRDDWIAFRDEITLETGRRYTDFEGIRIQDQILSWLKNAGFAFATVSRDARVDSSANTVDLRMVVDSGPRGYVSEIQVEGIESVDTNVVMRELPFRVGDRFDARDLSQGQRELFEMNLFRVVIAEVPEQEEDSTVVVRYRLREASPRYVTAQTGYGLEEGGQVQGTWTHRNFLGGARQFTASAVYSTGLGAARAGGYGAAQEKSAILRLNQPYLFSRKLSGAISPQYVRGEDPLLDQRFEEIELNTSLLYTIYNFRTITFNHSISRARPLGARDSLVYPTSAFDPARALDVSTQNAFSLSANLGNVDDYLQPNVGFLIRPRVEMGGILINLKDDVDYIKAQTEIIGYLPLNEDYTLSGRLFAGNIWPFGASRNQIAPEIEFRFDRIRFYAGGANDVRGYPLNQLGPKLPSVERNSDGEIANYSVEPLGGLAKLAANVELRTPFPFFGPEWKGAVFLDMGQVLPTAAEEREVRFRDISFGEMRFATGAGLRYRTLVGFVRLDVGFKLNPSLQDLATPEELYECGEVCTPDDVAGGFLKRFRLHLSIGQSF